MGKNKKYYVVWKGRIPGIYHTWEDCKNQIEGYAEAVYKSFSNEVLAKKAFKEGSEGYIGIDERIIRFSDEEKQLIGEPVKNSLAVDAACSGNPGVLEYRGVYTSTGREIFRKGPFPEGTVNIGEFLALVHGIALLKQKNSQIPVYSDSRTAISWVKNKRVKTKLERNNINEKLFELVDRAIYWLENNDYKNKILKWETEYWGEIPADFGRK
ncbi:MAG: ribonuclease H family protein [Bacteroidales bacterium]|nr:ribonuclease H family protein [Bacteroidales bacterium]